jgi:hypothetical protein
LDLLVCRLHCRSQYVQWSWHKDWVPSTVLFKWFVEGFLIITPQKATIILQIRVFRWRNEFAEPLYRFQYLNRCLEGYICMLGSSQTKDNPCISLHVFIFYWGVIGITIPWTFLLLILVILWLPDTGIPISFVIIPKKLSNSVRYSLCAVRWIIFPQFFQLVLFFMEGVQGKSLLTHFMFISIPLS